MCHWPLVRAHLLPGPAPEPRRPGLLVPFPALLELRPVQREETRELRWEALVGASHLLRRLQPLGQPWPLDHQLEVLLRQRAEVEAGALLLAPLVEALGLLLASLLE